MKKSGSEGWKVRMREKGIEDGEQGFRWNSSVVEFLWRFFVVGFCVCCER